MWWSCLTSISDGEYVVNTVAVISSPLFFLFKGSDKCGLLLPLTSLTHSSPAQHGSTRTSGFSGFALVAREWEARRPSSRGHRWTIFDDMSINRQIYVRCSLQELLTFGRWGPLVRRVSLFGPFELEAAGGRSSALDLLDRPFRGPVLLPSFRGRQVEGLGLAF